MDLTLFRALFVPFILLLPARWGYATPSGGSLHLQPIITAGTDTQGLLLFLHFLLLLPVNDGLALGSVLIVITVGTALDEFCQTK